MAGPLGTKNFRAVLQSEIADSGGVDEYHERIKHILKGERIRRELRKAPGKSTIHGWKAGGRISRPQLTRMCIVRCYGKDTEEEINELAINKGLT